MSSIRLLSTNDETNSYSENGVIIKDVFPHSISDEDNNINLNCPNIFNWCVKDALGLSCGILTWLLFFYAEFVIVFIILIPKNYSLKFNLFNLFIFHFLEFLAISSHCRTMFSNPVCICIKIRIIINTNLNYLGCCSIEKCYTRKFI
jgi:hypothetical protein